MTTKILQVSSIQLKIKIPLMRSKLKFRNSSIKMTFIILWSTSLVMAIRKETYSLILQTPTMVIKIILIWKNYMKLGRRASQCKNIDLKNRICWLFLIAVMLEHGLIILKGKKKKVYPSSHLVQALKIPQSLSKNTPSSLICSANHKWAKR